MTAKTLMEAVLLKYRSISAFARAAGWSYPTAYRAVTEARALTLPEIQTMVRLLGLTDPGEIVRLFRLTGEEHTT